jgi:hypothetical protein
LVFHTIYTNRKCLVCLQSTEIKKERKEKKEKKKEKYLVKNCIQKYARYNNLIRYIRDLNRFGHLYTQNIINEKACD